MLSNPKVGGDAGAIVLPASGAGEAAAVEKRHHAKGLVAIGLFKLGKAAFFLLLGMGALHLVHVNLGDLALRAATFLHADPEGPTMLMLQDRADTVSGHQLRQAGGLALAYSMVSVTEGVGLLMEKTWAEYLTLVLTICGLPLELFEIFRKPTATKFGVLVFNLLILLYLLWFIRRSKMQDEGRLSP